MGVSGTNRFLRTSKSMRRTIAIALLSLSVRNALIYPIIYDDKRYWQVILILYTVSRSPSSSSAISLATPDVLTVNDEIKSKNDDGTTEDISLTDATINFLSPIDVRLAQPVDPITKRANATLLMLARNSDINGAVNAVRSLEERFNSKLPTPYPWVFLNEVRFSEDFKREVSYAASGEVHFGLINAEDWYMPDWIDERLAETGKHWLKNLDIPYASSTSYRNMCRFNSGVRPLSLEL